jgi:hypothetical protein
MPQKTNVYARSRTHDLLKTTKSPGNRSTFKQPIGDQNWLQKRSALLSKRLLLSLTLSRPERKDWNACLGAPSNQSKSDETKNVEIDDAFSAVTDRKVKF